jgi:hypothetical protein
MISYKHTKSGNYLQVHYMGDGEYECGLVETINQDCIFNLDWPLEHILENCDEVYDTEDKPILDDLGEEDFEIVEVEIKVKQK